jgi:hypothetical protein
MHSALLLAHVSLGEFCVELVKTVLRLDFSAASRPWLELRDIIRVAAGDEAGEIQASPVTIERPQQRQRVVVQVRAVTLEQEMPQSADYSLAQAIEMTTRLNEASEFPTLSRIRYDAVFIEPFSLPFHELLVNLKECFLRPSTVVESATDIGLVLDKHENDNVKHVSLGPMDAEQLRSQYLRWPSEGIPDTFVFLGLAYERKTEVPFGAQLLRDFLRTAADWQASEAAAIASYLHGGEG